MMLLNFLLAFYMVYADVIREDGYHNYEGQFTVKNKGRMLRVLMSFRSVKLEECALHCVRHLRCRTYNYHHGKKDCELTNEDFYEIDLDTITHGWYNYGTPKRVNGGWSNWRDFTKCTKTCGDGTLKQYRECDSPTPAHGGADCYGKMIKRVKCNIRGCPVDGGFSKWKNSTNCTKPCGNGTMDQIRVCDSPKPEHGGANCTGKRNRTVECNTQECPVDGGFSNWKNSTNCTKPCGNGTIEQIRVCDSPTPMHGGAACKGIEKQTVECNTKACPVDGGFSNWKNSTNCTKACGNGTIEQIRVCDSPTPMYGGADCKGIKKQTVECNTQACPVDGGFSNWKNSTNCTKPCGNGTIEQIRVCDSPTPMYGGADCKGIKKQTVECNTQACPVDGGFSNWKNLTNCTKPCGNGTIEQIRVCDSPTPLYRGADCKGIKKQTVECNTQACPVDGGFSKWKNSTNCTKPCGNGTIEQIRVCDSPTPLYGGADCKGIKKQAIECNTQACPVDGGFSNWKNSTNCTKPCGNGTIEQIRVCDSPTPLYGGADCKGIKKQTVECNTQACPVDGGFSNWKNSTNCTKPCGNGTIEQIRVCDSPTPLYGGADCKGIKKQTVECNTQACPVDGGFSNWKNSTNCTKPCGNGTIEQIRVCDSPTPMYGGADCKGIKKQTVECNTQACPVDGGFSNWKNSTNCTKPCGNGTIEQIRVCDSPTPMYGGADCKGIKKQTVECNTQACPVDGGFSNWKNSTNCTKPCGNGTIEQIRVCDSPTPMYGGADCKGIKKQTVECNTQACPVVNVALGKNATQSSTGYYNSDDYLPSKAVDGNTGTYSWTNLESNPWWEVDLGNVKVIKEIRLVANVYSLWNQGLSVETRTTKEGSWKSCNNVGDVENRINEFQCLDQITNARFVRIRSTKKCALLFYEVEIFVY